MTDDKTAQRTFTVCVDNYDPPREIVRGTFTQRYDDTGAIVIDDPWALGLHNPQKAVYLIDDGATVFVYYVAGWSQGDSITPRILMLHPFPLSVGTRPDNGRPIDMSTWMLGPRRAYHLKVS